MKRGKSISQERESNAVEMSNNIRTEKAFWFSEKMSLLILQGKGELKPDCSGFRNKQKRKKKQLVLKIILKSFSVRRRTETQDHSQSRELRQKEDFRDSALRVFIP